MSFISKFEAAVKKLFGPKAAPQWIHTGQVVVSFAAPLVLRLINQFDEPTAKEAAPIITEVQTDLGVISVLVGDGTATPSLTDAVDRVQDNLQALLTAGHIKDAAIQSDVSLVVSELAALASVLPTK